MKKIHTLIAAALMSGSASAYDLCKKTSDDCLLYTVLNENSGYELFEKEEKIATFEMFSPEDWGVLKKGGQYFLTNTTGLGKSSEEIFFFQLTSLCTGCTPKIARVRHFSVNRIPDSSERHDANSYQLHGFEKKLDTPVPASGAINLKREMIPPYYKVKKNIPNPNIFYLALDPLPNGKTRERILYSPPTTKEEINPLLVGCITNCEFGDDALQVENKSYTFFGDINEKIAIKLELKKQGSSISGQYCYLKNCKDYIALNGSINASGAVDLEESVNKKVTGRMVFKSEGKNSFLGEWVSAAGKKMPLFIAREE